MPKLLYSKLKLQGSYAFKIMNGPLKNIHKTHTVHTIMLLIAALAQDGWGSVVDDGRRFGWSQGIVDACGNIFDGVWLGGAGMRLW